MMRSLWTAASGMKTQQLTVDTIANNLSNANTVGFKKERMEFKSLLYETLREAGDVATGGEPVNLQVGHGVRAAGSVKTFTQGNIERTDNPLDFAITGGGFFAVQTPDGETRYTKDGTFKLSIVDNQLVMSTVTGYPILGTDGNPLSFPYATMPERLFSDEFGNFTYLNDGITEDLGVQMQIVQFRNVTGLLAQGGGMYETTIASGGPIIEAFSDEVDPSIIDQGMVEMSNVQAVEEMVKMIIAQRAYELSSKAIQTSDDMLSLANQLKR